MQVKIAPEQIEELKKRFQAYVENFKHGSNDALENAILKENHSLRVCREILNIAHSTNLNADQIRLAEITALFHDIGRFEQYARYQTFVDRKSLNHALLGIEILSKKNLLDNLGGPIQKLVLRVISYHNHACLPDNDTSECLFFSKLLRDADKLDIYRVVTGHYRQKIQGQNKAVELDLPDTPGFSDIVAEDLMCGRTVDFRNLKNLNDFKLLQIGWIVDINFSVALQAIMSRGYLEMIRMTLPDSETIQTIFKRIHAHIQKRLSADNARTIDLN